MGLRKSSFFVFNSSVISWDWSQMSDKMWVVLWSGGVNAAIQWKKRYGIAHIWTCGQFDLVFHILIGGEWKLEQKQTLFFLELKPHEFCLAA